MSIATTFQKGIQCIKCKEKNCIPFPDKDGFTSCVYCGGTQDRSLAPPEPKDNTIYKYLFETDIYEDENREWHL